MIPRVAWAVGCCLLAGLPACAEPPNQGVGATLPGPSARPLRVLAEHPHDPGAFTQGLLWHAGDLWESTGLYGRSGLRQVEAATGRVLREIALPDDQFAEGLALDGSRLVQLTWREGVARVWKLPELEPLEPMAYRGEGWGLTSDGTRFIQSDGSAALLFRDLEDFRLLGRVVVRRGTRAVPYLNELEWVEGAVYANVWMSDEILRIDPESGQVTDAWDASALLTPDERKRAEVLNGIAWDPDRRVFYVTGKLWPRLFEVELPREPEAGAP